VLITVASFDDRGFLARLAGDLRGHEGVAIDEHDSPSQVAGFFRGNGIQRQGYGNGIFVAGIDASADIAPSILEAISMKARRLGPRFVYIWTLNHKRAIRNYLRMGVDGIFVNFHGLYEAVSKLRSILGEDEFRSKFHLAQWAHDPFAEPSDTAYILTVETGNRTHAGTDANLTFLLTGDRGSLSTTINSKPPGLFERGQTNRVTLIGEEDIGEIQTLTVRRDTGGNAPGWWLRGVTVESPRLPRSHRFNFDVWIPRRGATRWAGHARYRLEIRTSDRFLAGTDATVTFTLRGEGLRPDAPTEIIHEVDGSGRRFERGRTNTVTIEGPDIGRLLSLTVSHDGSELSDDWHLRWVRVQKPDETKRFDFNTWISEDSPTTRS
jgi:hypothetical protein